MDERGLIAGGEGVEPSLAGFGDRLSSTRPASGFRCCWRLSPPPG